jgi:hypothetical protein
MVCVRESRAQATPPALIHALAHFITACWLLFHHPRSRRREKSPCVLSHPFSAPVIFPSKTADSLFFLLKFSLPHAALLFVYVSEPRERDPYTRVSFGTLYTLRESCRRVSIFNAYPSEQINNSPSAEKQI